MRIDASAVHRVFLERMEAAAPGLLERYPPESYIDALDGSEAWGAYQHLPPENARFCRTVELEFGEGALESYQKLVLTTLIGQLEGRLSVKRLPDSVLALLAEYLRSILARLENHSAHDAGFYRPDNDVFCKQLCVCRLRMVPIGPELVDALGAIPRSVLLRGGLGQMVRGGWRFGVRAGAYKPFYTLHLDRTLAAHFTEDGYEAAYVRIAQMLEMNPEIKGLTSKAWFYDGRVGELSAELAYLRALPGSNGAFFLREPPGKTAVDNALKFSVVRREAYARGEYDPAEEWMIWPRKQLLAWARGGAISPTVGS